MKALLCRALGPIESLAVGDIDSPVPSRGQVLIDVKAAGVNFPDVLMVQGKYQFKPPLPFAPGCELAGIVKAVGEGVTHVKPGDRALALVMHGGFAEEAVADASGVVPLPDNVDFATAASFMFTYGTSYHALKDRAALQAGETLLVLGAAGGVGLADKLEVCRSRGADDTINYSSEDLRERLKALTEGRGVDVVYDPVGGEYSETALRSMAWRGRFLVVGFANGEIPKIPLNLALLKGCSIVGVFWGNFTTKEPKANAANIRSLIGWIAAGKLKPFVSERFPLARGVEALQAMQNRRVKGKVVIVPED